MFSIGAEDSSYCTDACARKAGYSDQHTLDSQTIKLVAAAIRFYVRLADANPFDTAQICDWQ
jgi:hypothetical protein